METPHSALPCELRLIELDNLREGHANYADVLRGAMASSWLFFRLADRK